MIFNYIYTYSSCCLYNYII